MSIKLRWMVVFFLIGALCVPNVWAKKKVKWKEEKSKYFVIYYMNAPKDFVKTVEDAAEEYYSVIAKNLGFTRYKSWSWENRAKIYIFDDQQHYVAVSHASGWSSGHALTRLKIIRTYPQAHGFFDSTLPHELGHIIFREYIGHKVRVPVWFEEGIAMYQEKAKRWGAHKRVKDAIENGTFIPLDQLSYSRLRRMSDTDGVSLVYSESASIVNYMISELGKARFKRFLRALKDGKTFKSAIQSVYVRFDGEKDLNKSWMRFIKDQ